jgi:hypothetical protein
MKTKHTHCLTLRLEPQIDELIAAASWERRTSKASWIRAAIRQRLGMADARPGRLTKKAGAR